MADTNDPAFEVIKHIMAKRDLSIWPLGSWLQRKETSEDRAALASLPLMMGYPEGGQIALFLTGWNERSVWGFDPPDDAYFAQLWHNGSQNERPDIWIFGRGRVDGHEFVVTTARLLAREIAAATGFGLSIVCAAMTGGEHGLLPDLPEPGQPPEPPISLQDELGEQGWFQSVVLSLHETMTFYAAGHPDILARRNVIVKEDNEHRTDQRNVAPGNLRRVLPKSKKQRTASMQLAASQGKSEAEIKAAGGRNFDFVNQANLRAKQERERRRATGRADLQRRQMQAGQQSGAQGDAVSALERLAALHQSGALDDEEFRAAKARIIGTLPPKA